MQHSNAHPSTLEGDCPLKQPFSTTRGIPSKDIEEASEPLRWLTVQVESKPGPKTVEENEVTAPEVRGLQGLSHEDGMTQVRKQLARRFNPKQAKDRQLGWYGLENHGETINLQCSNSSSTYS